MKDRFSNHAPQYAAFRPTYPKELYNIVLEQTRSRGRAWDCGTGNGQVAIDLSRHFKEVFATDISVNQIKNGSTSIKSMNSDQLNSNRLGFRGTEDLGGGLLASFWLEGGMAVDTGTPAGFNFTRRSTVSLTSSMGEIRLGRDYTNSFLTAAT